jgi:hypothetical protein
MPLPENIEEITERDLQGLIDNHVLELKKLEYKETLTINTEGEKKEFLADISSFANTTGGDIIYGIAEGPTHEPVTFVGLDITDIDELKLRLDSIIRDGIQPRIPNIHIKEIALQTNQYIIIIRIPKSWLNPHMVVFRGNSKFYSRASNGKYPMDVGEIRSAFIRSDSQIEKMKEFIQSRLSDINSGIYPVPFTNSPKLTLHIVPVSSFETQILENFQRLRSLSDSLLPMFNTLSFNVSFNADGFIVYTGSLDRPSRGYTQLFRNGVIEAVSSFSIGSNTPRIIPIDLIEWEIIGAVRKYTELLKMFNVEPPAYIFISLIGVKGLVHSGFTNLDGVPIQKDILILPNVELPIFGLLHREEESEQISELLKILKLPFDALSNSVGLPRSLSYDENGTWIRRLSDLTR